MADRTPKSILTGGFIIAAARGIGQIAQVSTFIIGARVLGPSDFGLFALVSAAAVLGSIAAQAGWTGFILSNRRGTGAVRETLTLSLMFGLVMCLAGLGFIATGALEGSEPVVVPLAVLFSIWVFIATCAEGQFAVLLHRERLAGAAACQIAAEIAGFITAVWCLNQGYGVLSLAWGRVAAQSVQLISMLALSRTLPTLHLSRETMRAAFNFSLHVLSSRLIANFRQYIGTFAVGGFLGAEAAGLFRLAQRLVGAVRELLSEPARAVAWAFFRRKTAAIEDLESDQARDVLQAAMERLMPALLSVAAPVMLGLALTADHVLVLLVGEEWRPAGPVVSILAIEALLLIPHSVTEPLLALRGKVRYMPAFSLVYVVLAVVVILPMAPYGLYPITVAHLVVGLAGFAMMLWAYDRVLDLDLRKIVAACAGLLPIVVGFAVCVLALSVLSSRWTLPPSLALLVVALPAAAAYLASLFWTRSDFMILLIRTMRRS